MPGGLLRAVPLLCFSKKNLWPPSTAPGSPPASALFLGTLPSTLPGFGGFGLSQCCSNGGVCAGGGSGGLNFFFGGGGGKVPVRLGFGKIMHLIMGLFRGAVFHLGGVPENSPLALMGRFPSLMGHFPTLGRFPKGLNGLYSISKTAWKIAHQDKAHQEVLEI